MNECSLDNICAPENAECINTQGGYECKCRSGYTGNPNRECVDINECNKNPCGPGAICVNLEGSSPGYQCKCPDKYIARGSPEYGCDKAECESDTNCIGNARCLNGFCYCPPPYLSDNDCTCPPNYVNDAYVGCLSKEETKISYAECTDKVVCPNGTVCYRGLCSRKDSCSTNKDCLNDSVCKMVNDNVGKQCVDPCDTVQCGPNAFCGTQNHEPACHCNTSYAGNPNDLLFGCSPKGPPSFMVYCERESDCDQKSVCKQNFAGSKICTDVCDSTQCGPNAFCRGVNKNANCFCAKHFIGDPNDLIKGCTLPDSAHLCTNDEDCSIEKSCILTLEGVRNCVEVCNHHQCSEGSKCVVRNHRPLCECLSGYARVSSPGPNGSILGVCEPHLCESDNECKHDEHCIVNMRGLLDCAPVCAEMQCGENADCISIAHRANCMCKSGYEGNAMDLIKGCQPAAYPACEGCKAREPRGCQSSPDCGDAEQCVDGLCRFLCMKDNECIVGERCLDGFCVPLGTRVPINLPPIREHPSEFDKTVDYNDDKYITPSTATPSTASDQKIVQPNLKPSAFPHLKTDTSYKKQPVPSAGSDLDNNYQIDKSKPGQSEPNIVEPDLSRTYPDKPVVGQPEIKRPGTSEPTDVYTISSDQQHPPSATRDEIYRIKTPQAGVNYPDRNVSTYEDDTLNKADKIPHLDVDRVNNAGHGIDRSEFKHPITNQTLNHRRPTEAPVDHDIYNPPEFKPDRPDDVVYKIISDVNKPDSRTTVSEISESREPSELDQNTPKYKHPVDFDNEKDQTPTVHKKQPSISERKPMPSMDYKNEPVTVPDKEKPSGHNLTSIRPSVPVYPDNQQPIRPDFKRPEAEITVPNLSRPYDKPGSISSSDFEQPDNRQQPVKPDFTRPDLLHPKYDKPKIQYIAYTTELPSEGDSYLGKDEKSTRPDILLPNNKPYTPPSVRITGPDVYRDRVSTYQIKPTTDKYEPNLSPVDFRGEKYDPRKHTVPSVKPTVDITTQTEKPDRLIPSNEKDDFSSSKTKTDIQQPSISTRPELKWPTRIGETRKPFESESRQPITTPESVRIDVTKPSKITETSRQPSSQPKYPVSSRPNITRPETYTRSPVDSIKFVSTSSPSIRWKDTHNQTSRQPITDSSQPQSHLQDITTKRPITFTLSSIDKKQGQSTTNRPQGTFTEFKSPDQYTKTDIVMREIDKSKELPSFDQREPELKKPYETDYSISKSSIPVSTSSQPNVATPSSRSQIPVTTPDTRTPSSEKQPDIRKPSDTRRPLDRPETKKPITDITSKQSSTSRPPLSTRQPQDKHKTTLINKTTEKTITDINRQQTYVTDSFTSRPDTQRTTLPDQSRITEVKHSSIQEFTSRSPPNIKTQTSSSIDFKHQPTQSKPISPIDSNVPKSSSSKEDELVKPPVTSGEKCINNYCVLYFDEDGMLQVPRSNKTNVQPIYSGDTIATITTTEDTLNESFKSINKSSTIDHPTIDPNQAINIRICVDGVCRDKIKGCFEDNDCPSDKTCDLEVKQCISPCYTCGVNSECSAVDHRAVCLCSKGFVGEPFDKEVGCFPAETTDPSTERTIPPVSHINVMCQADGIAVGVKLGGYDGIIYVKGYSQEYECRRLVRSDERDVIDFKVMFGQCGLFHSNGEASFILVVQKHPKLVTYRARAYHIKCMYNTGERVVTLGFNVSMITTSGTIANTGPPPTCTLSICTLDGNEVSSAEIGDDLLLNVNVQPDFIYGGFARSCIAKTIEEEGEFQYEVTDANGCATDPSIFGNWMYDENKKSLVARFNAFKFPSSNNLRFQCNIRICFNNCPTANCEDTEAYGRRRRRELEANDENDQSMTLTNSLGLDTYKEGQLREEIQVQSNAILTFEKREQSEPFGQQRSEEELDHVCLPKLGLILSMIITTLLAIVAVAVAISCWLMAYRRKVNHGHRPLSHPSEIPNPLFSTPEPALPIEPIPDYYT